MRYVTRGTDWAQDEPDTISRPEVLDTSTGETVGGPWALNDWGRAERFAAELEAIDGQGTAAGNL